MTATDPADNDDTRKPPIKVTIYGNSERGYSVTVWENLCGQYYRHQDFRTVTRSTRWGARRVAKRLHRRAMKAEQTQMSEMLTDA